MKKLVFVIVILCCATSTFAQKVKEKNIPAEVKAVLQKQFPNLKELEWSKEDGNYEAEFEQDDNEFSVIYDAKGNLIETEVEIEQNQLPNGVMEYVKANYANKKVKETAKITDANGKVSYEVEIQGMDLIFDSEGKFSKVSKK